MAWNVRQLQWGGPAGWAWNLHGCRGVLGVHCVWPCACLDVTAREAMWAWRGQHGGGRASGKARRPPHQHRGCKIRHFPHSNPTYRCQLQVKLAVCRFTDTEGRGVTSDAIKCVRACREEGVLLSSNSWGGAGFSYFLQEEIRVGINSISFNLGAVCPNGSCTILLHMSIFV